MTHQRSRRFCFFTIHPDSQSHRYSKVCYISARGGCRVYPSAEFLSGRSFAHHLHSRYNHSFLLSALETPRQARNGRDKHIWNGYPNTFLQSDNSTRRLHSPAGGIHHNLLRNRLMHYECASYCSGRKSALPGGCVVFYSRRKSYSTNLRKQKSSEKNNLPAESTAGDFPDPSQPECLQLPPHRHSTQAGTESCRRPTFPHRFSNPAPEKPLQSAIHISRPATTKGKFRADTASSIAVPYFPSSFSVRVEICPPTCNRCRNFPPWFSGLSATRISSRLASSARRPPKYR